MNQLKLKQMTNCNELESRNNQMSNAWAEVVGIPLYLYLARNLTLTRAGYER